MSFERPSVAAPQSHGALRLEEVDVALLLPQILRLRDLAWARRVSLEPDLLRWCDAADIGAAHWCVFNDSELVAAGRMSFHTSLEDVVDVGLSSFERRGLRTPLAVMSHCVVHPLYRGLHLDKALDAARIERADQLRQTSLLTVAASADRAAALEALGFRLVGAAREPTRSHPVVLALDLSRSATIAHRQRLTRPL